MTVRIISDNQANKSLEDYLDLVAEDQIPTVITSTSGHHVVLLTLSDYQSMEETIHLLSSPVNATRLNESIAQFAAATAG
ncbi:type II toxin-antitoxin system Phd/YefM family antitoxin [Pseudidiomarina aquimaris]|uniref:type II toxin-antitoxin system Phd/YefM family antitoxin n=1 Tax=Pseudidiomarina aquimaris TaxID=641841 RepID=UPI003A98241C